MPLHRIYHPASAFSSTDKAALSQHITDMYTSSGLPAFYVVVLFIPIEKDSFYVGGQLTNNFIRIVSQHLARQLPNDEAKKQFMEKFDKVLAPFIKDKGYNWEVNYIISFVLFFNNSFRYILRKYQKNCGEKMAFYHQIRIVKQKKNGYDLTNQFHIES
jgi:phenylpyruvate tautomerase PptA (4-oxalocrotonate tautomerase family)